MKGTAGGNEDLLLKVSVDSLGMLKMYIFYYGNGCSLGNSSFLPSLDLEVYR
jgi:hypothetical protein